MPRERISGRAPEISVLDKALKSAEPEFIAIYGRRRVGKTFLVREFFGDSRGSTRDAQSSAPRWNISGTPGYRTETMSFSWSADRPLPG